MQKVHGPPVETPGDARHGFLDLPVLTALAVGLSLLLILYAVIYFGFFGAS